ncbi:hypothetical protein MKX01_003659 [Papaver californicum]|nr:hypothetical protein MKX01_003659 [Papaver californicum]
MEEPSSLFLGFGVVPVLIISVSLGALIALTFFSDYFRQKRSEVETILKPDEIVNNNNNNHKSKKSSHNNYRKPHSRSQSHASDKDQVKGHHPLDVNTLKGHGDSVTALCFSSDGRNLATACADGIVRIFKLDDALSKSFKFLRINLPAGGQPTAVAFSDGASSVVVSSQNLSGSSLYMYGEGSANSSNDGGKQQPKLPVSEIKWEHRKVHQSRAIVTLAGTAASYGTADGSTIIVSCSEGKFLKMLIC